MNFKKNKLYIENIEAKKIYTVNLNIFNFNKFLNIGIYYLNKN